jgi:hypothetical protein
VSSQAWRFPFVEFAQALVDAHRGEVVERVGSLGTDEVYWDLRIGGHLLTLHSQHFLGVYLRAPNAPSEEVLRQLEPFVVRYLSERQQGGARWWLRAQWRRLRGGARVVFAGVMKARS